MARQTGLNSPFLLGFDELDALVDQLTRASGDSYPPYNVEQCDAHTLRITIALAGFSRNDVSVTIEGQQLVVSGKMPSHEGRIFLHQGIAARQFVRRFLIADGLDVACAEMKDGLLHIDLVRPEPETQHRKIEIS